MNQIEDLLRCPICYDLFTTAMILPLCSHNFCSLCIRQHFQQQKLHCPVCRKAASTIDLKNNRLLDELVDTLKKNPPPPPLPLLLLPPSISTTTDSSNVNTYSTTTTTTTTSSAAATIKPLSMRKKKLSSPDTNQSTSSSTQPAPSTITTRRMTTRSMSAASAAINNNDSDGDDEEDVGGDKLGGDQAKDSKSVSPSSLSRKRKSPKKQQQQKKRKSITDSDGDGDDDDSNGIDNSDDQSSASTPPLSLDLPSPDKIQCPSCKSMVVSQFLERHLDMCLDSGQNNNNSSNNQQIVSVRLTPLPKLCYHLLKTKQLKDFLKKLNMKTTGDRQTLVNRHRDYTTMRNAECDSLNPKTHEEIVEIIMTNEQLTAKPKSTNNRRSKSLPTVLSLPAPSPTSSSLISIQSPPSPPLASQPTFLSQSTNSISSNSDGSNDMFEILKLQILSRKKPQTPALPAQNLQDKHDP